MATAIRGKVAIVLGLLLVNSLALALDDDVVRFGFGSLAGLQTGQSYVYSFRVRLKGPDSNVEDKLSLPALGDPYGILYFRVLVTDIIRDGDATRVKARLDSTNEHGEPLEAGLYSLVLISKGDVTSVTAENGRGGRARLQGGFGGMPWVFSGWPPVAAIGREGATESIGVPQKYIPYKYTSTYDAKTGKVKVAVDYYREAYSDDPEKGRRVEYWVRDQKKLEPTVPMGQEASPLIDPHKGFVGDRTRQYNVRPVTVGSTETQTWEPGSAFPTKITRKEESGKVSFEATLLRVEQVSVEEPAAAPAETNPAN